MACARHVGYDAAVLLELLLAALAAMHGASLYTLVFLLLACGSIGAPWSQDVLLLAAPTVIAPASLNVRLLIVTAWLALVAGDALSLWIGRHYGARWVRRPWAARFVPPDRLPGLEEGMRRH